MKICELCGEKFPYKITIDGKKRNLASRRYCLKCSPFGTHNTIPKYRDEQHKTECEQREHSNKNCLACGSKLPLSGKKTMFCDKNCKLNYYKSQKTHSWDYSIRKKQCLERKVYLIHLAGMKCCRCGYQEQPAILEFHHRNKTEKASKEFGMSITFIRRTNFQTLLAEYDKCELVCPNCHRAIHYPQCSKQNLNSKEIIYNGQSQLYEKQFLKGIERKKQLINQFGGKCYGCGYDENYSALEFHHNDAASKCFELDLRNVANRKWEKVQEEANKCCLKCANCHRSEHLTNIELNTIFKNPELVAEMIASASKSLEKEIKNGEGRT